MISRSRKGSSEVVSSKFVSLSIYYLMLCTILVRFTCLYAYSLFSLMVFRVFRRMGSVLISRINACDISRLGSYCVVILLARRYYYLTSRRSTTCGRCFLSYYSLTIGRVETVSGYEVISAFS